MIADAASKRQIAEAGELCVQGATVLFTAELLLPSGKRIELIGCMPCPPFV